jgi:type I restriction enzyme M protein
MSISDLQKRTTTNIQEKVNLIRSISYKLVGTYKPHEYGNVVLPMCVIKRLSDTLAATKDDVIRKNEELDRLNIIEKDRLLRAVSGHDFYNTSEFTFEGLLSDPDNIAGNFRSYLNHFSDNVIDVIEKFDFGKEITKLDQNGILYNVISEFCTEKAYLGDDEISAVDMGYVFEDLFRKFSESFDEQAGAHFTARDIIYLMTEVLVAPHRDNIASEGITASIYDMAMGTSQMLDCLGEKLREIDPDAKLTEYGQELNGQTFAIAKSNMLIRGGNAENMKHGNTLNDDKFEGFKFDYIISNPPFGIEWKNEKKDVEEEHKRGDLGRFKAGLPGLGDSQQLFVLNGVSKLKDTGRMAIIQNGSPLFKGDAGSGESNIRGYLLEHDWLEAIIQLPNFMFYNTGIPTYIWVVSKSKSVERIGKVQLIDASKCCIKRRKTIGFKRNEFDEACIDLIMQAYNGFTDDAYTDGDLVVESKVKDNEDFKYKKVTLEYPSAKDLKPEREIQIIPWKEDVQANMERNVLPYRPKARLVESRTKIGYEIPFTREFHKYVQLESSEVILSRLKELEVKETELMNKIFE